MILSLFLNTLFSDGDAKVPTIIGVISVALALALLGDKYDFFGDEFEYGLLEVFLFGDALVFDASTVVTLA